MQTLKLFKLMFVVIFISALQTGCLKPKSQKSIQNSATSAEISCEKMASDNNLPYKNVVELGKFVTANPVKFYTDHFLSIDKSLPWAGKHLYNCFAIDWTLNQVFIHSKKFYELGLVIKREESSFSFDNVPKVENFLKSHPALREGFFASLQHSEIKNGSASLRKLEDVLNFYNGRIADDKSFEELFPTMKAHKLFTSLQETLKAQSFAPEKVLTLMCQALVFISNTHSLASIGMTHYATGALNTTPLTEPVDVSLASHCRAAEVINHSLSYVPFIHSIESVFTESDFLSRYASLANFLGLSSMVLGVDKMPDGTLSPKIDGQFMNPLNFWNHDLTHSVLQIAGYGFVFFDVQGRPRSIELRLRILSAMAAFNKFLLAKAKNQTVQDSQNYKKMTFFLTHEQLWRRQDNAAERHQSLYEGKRELFNATGYSYVPLHPCAFNQFDRQLISDFNHGILENEFNLNKIKTTLLMRDLKSWTAELCSPSLSHEDAIYGLGWVENLEKLALK